MDIFPHRRFAAKFASNVEDNEHILQVAIDMAMEAGRIQLRKFRSRHLEMETKTSIHDVVTEVDKECEAFLLSQINEAYPSHSVLGEETGLHHHESDWEWVIDPLDGTNNYSQGLPIFSVSIGVQYKGETQVGVVYAPYLDELFTASKGGGSAMNGRAIHVSRKTNFGECVLGTGFPYDKGTVTSYDNNLDNVCAILPKLRGLRRMGSAAYDLCCVASGILDGYWEMGLKPWDMCAGALIVKEAGGKVIPFRHDRGIALVAANEALANQILPLLGKDKD